MCAYRSIYSSDIYSDGFGFASFIYFYVSFSIKSYVCGNGEKEFYCFVVFGGVFLIVLS